MTRVWTESLGSFKLPSAITAQSTEAGFKWWDEECATPPVLRDVLHLSRTPYMLPSIYQVTFFNGVNTWHTSSHHLNLARTPVEPEIFPIFQHKVERTPHCMRVTEMGRICLH